MAGTLGGVEHCTGVGVEEGEFPTAVDIFLTSEPSLCPSSGHQQGFCMMCIMEAHVNKVLHSPVSAILPLAVLKVFRRKSCQVLWQVPFPSCIREPQISSFLGIGEHFQPGREEDAHDFLCCTVNAMQRACLSANNE